MVAMSLNALKREMEQKTSRRTVQIEKIQSIHARFKERSVARGATAVQAASRKLEI